MAITTYSSLGKILSIAECDPGKESEIVKSVGGAGCIQGSEYAEGHYFDLEKEEFVLIPERPNINYSFDYTTKSWIDPRTLADLKAEAWTRIKQRRDAEEFASFAYNGMTFDGDVNAQRRLAGYISVSKTMLAAGQTFSADFILADNSVVNLTAEDFVQIELAKVMQVAQAFAKATTLRNLIDSATTKEEIEAIVW